MSNDPMKWLRENRNLSESVLRAMRVKGVEHKQIGTAAAFPYLRHGEIYAAKFRAPDRKDWRSTHGVTRGVYNEDALRGFDTLPVVITEGEIDALSCIQAGFDRSISLPDGWTEQGNKTDALIAVLEVLEAAPAVIVASDNDAAGESLPRTVANLLPGCDVRHATWPEGCKDPNDVLVHHGEGALASCLNAARPIDPEGGQITGFSDMPPVSDRRILRPGCMPFDRAVALEVGALSVWTGIPGSGKSTFLTWLAHRIAINEDIRVGLFPFETHPHTLRNQLSRIRTGQDFAQLDTEERKSLLAVLDERFRVVHRKFDDDFVHRVTWAMDTAHTLVTRDRCKLIILDPWNELEHFPAPNESMTQYMNAALQFIRQTAAQLETHIAVVAHPRKIHDETRAPGGYDIADSAAWANKPSLGVTIHRRTPDDEEPFTEISTWKVRDTLLYGFDRGRTRAAFDPFTQSYGPYEQRHMA